MYGTLPRIDVKTTVEWHEHNQTLKVAFPLNMKSPQARVGVPYGSVARPTNGQENPGQKWMDVTEVQQSPLSHAMPLDLSGVFNHRSSGDFDGEKRGYPRALMPSAGVHNYGAAAIPFAFAAPGGKDNIACDGQTIALPSGTPGNTLFLLGAAAPSPQSSSLTLICADGTHTTLPFSIGDWVAGGGAGNESAFMLDQRTDPNGTVDTVSKPHLWIATLTLPPGESPITQIILPRNRTTHLFALTRGAAVPPTPLYGLTVLNDSKYGSDTNGNVFRLTLLRSSHEPDPNPDEGTQTFTYSLLPHPGDWRDAGAESAGLALNIPLRTVVTNAHAGKATLAGPIVAPANVLVGAFKHAEDTDGYIVRLFETCGKDSVARIDFGQNVHVEETDLLERPVHKRKIAVDRKGIATFPIGHDQIVTLHVTGLPEAHAE
jgi:alpha-mannosidase